MECREIMERVVKQCSVSLSISKSNILIGINKQETERIKMEAKKKCSDFSIFNGKLFFKECRFFSLKSFT